LCSSGFFSLRRFGEHQGRFTRHAERIIGTLFSFPFRVVWETSSVSFTAKSYHHHGDIIRLRHILGE